MRFNQQALNRFLSPRECARIQSFPDRFIFKGTTIENYTKICNAVPPLLAKAFGYYIIDISEK
ncbi:DNA cytosine methyltransferase [Okeania sp. SIO2C9]|uniref:DNA cytosine methyltransferase n=1 Tax=Okeania sp. SIO2C9 TaxID=2607791 RepID=UPI0025D01C44|nr:DNA cytosine methyltransferase [Okeania sp. SIO2C9]